MLGTHQSKITSSSPEEAYTAYVQQGKLMDDSAQRHVALELGLLRNHLMKPSWQRFISFDKNPPRSVYIWGDVGRGKSLLMDMFFDTISLTAKRRIHFHAFMLEVHAAIHEFRKNPDHKENPVSFVAREFAKNTRVLCLDEFQVTDVADAMILHKLFITLFDRNFTVVMTSNRPPEELYKGGLQREKFMEFVNFAYANMKVLELSSAQDYRMQHLRALESVYLFPANENNNKLINDMFAEFIHQHAPLPVVLEVQGRLMQVKESFGGIARFTFQELCERALGAGDYLAIAKRFHTVFITSIPTLSRENRNEAKRFVTLIDTFYDHHVKLICTASASPQGLYQQGDGVFEFQRTVSRLVEMQSASYLASNHIC